MYESTEMLECLNRYLTNLDVSSLYTTSAHADL